MSSNDEDHGKCNDQDSVVDVPTASVEDVEVSDEHDRRTLPAMDDKSIFKRAYELIDRTSRRFRRPSQQELDQRVDHDSASFPAITESDQSVSPAVARARAKSASAFAAAGDKNRNSTATGPGAEHVPTRAPGLSPAFYLRLIRNDYTRRAQESAQQERTAVSDPTSQSSQGQVGVTPESSAEGSTESVAVVDGELMNHSFLSKFVESFAHYRRIWWSILFLTFIAVGASVVVALHFSKPDVSKHDESPTTATTLSATTLMDPPTYSCTGWSHRPQPSVITQCSCFGNITIVATDVHANYHRLMQEGFIKSALPGFTSTIDSCDPSNQALVWLASATGSSSPGANLRQRLILALLYILWNGRHWTVDGGWLSSDSECAWFGLICDRLGTVVKIDLSNNQLSGKIETMFAMLTKLQALSLGNNALSGSVPSELGKLAGIGTIVLEGNKLIGTIPMELTKLTFLRQLSLGWNFISGTIPTWLGELSNLEALSLSNNTFIAMAKKGNAFPTELGLLTRLQSLGLSAVRLHGTIPTELFGLGRSLTSLLLNSNFLTGTIPKLVGNLPNLSVGLFEENMFIGTIPSEFGQCTGLAYLYLNSNRLTGTVPDSLLQIPLVLLNLTGNDLTGTVPARICFRTRPELCPTSRISCNCCVCNT